MKHKVSELEGRLLDAAVAHCEIANHLSWSERTGPPKFSTDWAYAGPLIERERIAIVALTHCEWLAELPVSVKAYGPTPLIAAMRAHVIRRLGDYADLP